MISKRPIVAILCAFTVGLLAAPSQGYAQAPTLRDVATMSDAKMKQLQDTADLIAQQANLPRTTAEFGRDVRAGVALHGQTLAPQWIDGMVNAGKYASSIPQFFMHGSPAMVGQLFSNLHRNIINQAKGDVAYEQWELAVVAGEMSYDSYTKLQKLTALRQVTRGGSGGGMGALARNKATEGILSGTSTCAMGNSNWQWNSMCHP